MVNAKIAPLLNADQQEKFTEIRDEYRRQLIEKLGSQALAKAEAGVSSFLDQHGQSQK